MNYLSVPEGASGEEVARTEALDAVLTAFFRQRGTSKAGGAVIGLVAHFGGGRLSSVSGITYDVAAGHGVARAGTFRVSARDLRGSLERLCAALAGAGNAPLVAFVLLIDQESGGLVMETALDDAAASVWDIDVHGVDVVAARLAALGDGAGAATAGGPGGGGSSAVESGGGLVRSVGGVIAPDADLSAGPVSLRLDPDDVVVGPSRAAFAADVAAGWPRDFAGVALLAVADPVETNVFVVGYAEGGQPVLRDDAWVSAATREALVGVAARATPAWPGPRVLLATYVPQGDVWSLGIEASSGMGRFAIGPAQAVMIAQEISPFV